MSLHRQQRPQADIDKATFNRYHHRPEQDL